MTAIDLIGAVELTLSAAIIVATLSILAGVNTTARLKYSAILTGWFVLVVIMAATHALNYQRRFGVPGLGLMVTAPVILIWFALLRSASMRQRLDNAPLWILVAAHAERVLGVSFLILHQHARLPAPFAPAAGWGDIIAGLTAIPLAWLIYKKGRGWQTLLTVWNIYGLLDLISAITLGALSSPGPLRVIFEPPGTGLMTSLPWLLIPAYLVPLLAIIHLAIFYRLIGRPAHADQLPAPGTPDTPDTGWVAVTTTQPVG